MYNRRLQTAAVLMFWWYIPLCIIALVLMVFFPVMWIFLIPYCVFWFTDQAPENGGRRVQWVRCGYRTAGVWTFGGVIALSSL